MNKYLRIYLKYILLFILPIAVFSFQIFQNNQELGTLNNCILIIFFIMIYSFIFTYLNKFKQNFHFPIFAMSSFYILVCYLGLFLFDKYEIYPKYNAKEFNYALNILFFSYVFYSLGYLILKFLGKNFSRIEINSLNSTIDEIFLLGTLCLLGTIFFYYFIEIHIYFSFLAQIKYPLLLFGSGLLITYISLEKKNKTIYNKIFSILLIIVPVILELVSGAFSFPFMITFLFFIFYSVIKKKIIYTPFIILFIIFLVFHVGKYDLRKNIALETSDKDNNLSIFYSTYNKIFSNVYSFNKVINCINRGSNVVLSFDKEKVDCNYVRDLRLEKRIFHSMESLLTVTSMSPKEIPFWNGYSYKILSSKLIPRIFWKEKPSDNLGNEFGRRYNVLTKKDEKLGYEDDFVTSWNMPVFNEFFVNFGIKGSILGSFLLGLIIGFIEKIFTLKNNYNLEKVLSFFIFCPLFLMESHLSLLFGALIQSYIFLIVFSLIFLFLKRKILN